MFVARRRGRKGAGMRLWFCVLAIWLSLPSAVRALDYTLVPLGGSECAGACPAAIYASGSITAGEAETFGNFLRNAASRYRLARLLIIHSPGGNAYGGIALGTMIRRTGMDVVVARPPDVPGPGKTALQHGLCGSACVFVLAGGKKRVVPPGSAVAVHGARQIHREFHDPLRGQITPRTALGQGEIIRLFGDYYAQMGIARELARLGEQTPHEQIRVLSPAEMRRFRLAVPRL